MTVPPDPGDGPGLSIAEFRLQSERIGEWIADYLEGIRDYPVLPAVQPNELRDRLPRSAPDQGEPFDHIFQEFRDLILPAVTHWNHPRFHGYFSVSAAPAGILGEFLTAALNTNGMVWKASPASTELELVVVDWVRQWLGLGPEHFGLIFDTASTSTLHALAAAREFVQPDSSEEGMRPGLVVYCSEQAHSSVDKAAITLGFGRKHIRHIATDSVFRMVPEALETAIRKDRTAGLTPCAVVATVGATSTTSVDPVSAIAAIAQRENLWLHVDAAYGGACALADETRHHMDGADRADSVVMNPHKWFFTPIDLSILFTRRPEVLRKAFALTPEYLKTGSQAVDLMDYGVPLGRRFRALKLWFVMRSYGRNGIASIIRTHIEWARWLADRIERDERLELAAPVTMALVCFRMKGSDERNESLLDTINRSGIVFLSHTRLSGQFVLRVSIGNV